MSNFRFEISGTIENLELMIEVPEDLPIENREVRIFTGMPENPIQHEWIIEELDLTTQNTAVAIRDFSAATELGDSQIIAAVAGEEISHYLPIRKEESAPTHTVKPEPEREMAEPETVTAKSEDEELPPPYLNARLKHWYRHQKNRFFTRRREDGAGGQPPVEDNAIPDSSNGGSPNRWVIIITLLLLAVVGVITFSHSWQLGVSFLLLIALWFRFTIRIIPADRIALREIAGYIHGYVEGGIHSTLVPYLGTFIEYPTQNQDIDVGSVEVVTASGLFDPKRSYDPALPENGQPTKEEWDEMEKNLGRQRLEKDYRWEVATLKVNANVNFSWPRSLELLTKARKIAPSPVLPDHDAATKAEKLQVLRDFFMEPIQDAIQDVTAGRIWVQIYRDVNWITDKISEKLASRLSNPINRAGLLAVDELRQFISFRVTVTIVLPEALALSLPRVQAAKYEADAVRATADGEEYKRIREGKGSAEALRFAYEVKERHPSVVAAEAIEKSQGTHVGVTSYMLNELNKMFGRGYGRPERRDNR